MHFASPLPAPARQRGAASLLVTLVLLAATLLGVGFASRGLLLEARMSSNQVRATLAFEAAEAGLEWTLANLNRSARIGADCRPTPGAVSSFRDRYVAMTESPDGFTGRLAGASPLRAACVRSGTGWACSCPSDAPATPLAAPDEALPAAFVVDFLPGRRQGVLRVVATGCSGNTAACTPGSAAGADASARVEVSFALLPALASAPAAALTARGRIDTGLAEIGVHNVDPQSAGLGLHAGTAIAAPAARFSAPAGASLANSLVGNDTALAGLDADRLFVSIFGLSKPAWRSQPAVRQVGCAGECGAELAAAVGGEVIDPMVWIDGDASIDGPVTLGRADRPVLIVVDGPLALRGAVTVHGLVYARSVTWNDDAGGAGWLRGALVTESDYEGNAAPDLHRDAAVLAALQRRTGSFVRVAGSWRDF